MMYALNTDLLRTKLSELLRKESSPENFSWLVALPITPQNICRNFSLAGRKFPKQKPDAGSEPFIYITSHFLQTNWSSWTIRDICRLYQLLQLEAGNKQDYLRVIEELFLQADLGELTLLYKALPFYAYPEAWIRRCAEGIRSNMGTVLEALMQENSYPAEHLTQAAWNQMVLKAVFTGQNLALVYGLQKRKNEALAASLLHYAEERQAAGREVDPQIWHLIQPFFGEASEILQSKFLKIS